MEAATPIITAPPGDLQVDVGSTLTFTEGTITTFVGQDTNGFADGTGTAAQFSTDAQGITFDLSGNIYLTDTSNHRIRKITPSGVVSTFAGSGTAGDVNDTGTAAQLDTPTDIIYTNSGVLYYADSGNNQIKQVNSAAVVSKFIGKAAAGDVVGKSAQVKFDEPISVAFDQTNNYMYVMDKNNFKIKKIDLNLSTNSNSYCTEFVGDGTQGHIDATGTSARISYGGIDVDSSGNLYLADTANHCIRKITPAGVVTTLAGSGGSSGDAEGSGTTARFSSPSDLVVDDDDFIFVADTGNNKIKRVTSGGVAMDLAGTGTSAVTDGSLFDAEFISPLSVGFYDDTMYVSQSGNGRIREMLRPDHFWVIDTDSATVSVSLEADNGVLTIDLSGGGTITAGSNGSASFTVQGLLDQLNKAFSTLEYDHDMGFTGTDTITYSATDGVNSTGDSTINILVQTNTAPSISAISNENLANHGVDADIDFTVTDAEADSFTVIYSKISGDAAVTLTDNGGGNWNILIDPDNGFTGVIAMKIIAEDTYDATSEEEFFVYVNYTPQDPVLNAIGDQTTDEDVTKNLTLSGSDGNGDTLTYSAVVNSGNVSAIVAGTSLDLIPDADWNGVASITVTVDDGAGGTDDETFNLTVNPVSDPPTTSDNTVTGDEDEVFVFSTIQFPYSDPESDPLDSIRLQAASAGTFWIDTDSSLALDGAEVVVANNDVVDAADISKLSFLPDANQSGTAYATFLFEVNDGTSYSNQATMTLDINAVNDAPVTADNTVTAVEDTVFTFSSGDFPYTDEESDPVNKVRLQAATAGTLWVDTDSSGALDGAEVAVVNNDEVLAADFTKLSFLADPDDNGSAYATFDFEVHDGTDYSTTQETMTIDVTAVNDAPTTADNTVTATEDTVFTFSSGDFPYTDVDSDPINKVRLQAATAGTLWVDTDSSGALDGAETAIANNDEVLAADFTKLSFLADPDDNGVAYATFDFEVHDGTVYSTTQETMTIDVTAVNDAPTTADNTVTATEDTVFTFSSGDFPYTDIDSDPISKVRLQAVTAGTLWVDTDSSGSLDGAEVAVANNDEVLAADFTKLSFLADPDDNGVAYATFDFEVHDGTDYSTTQETMTIDVTAVNDPPVTADNTVTAVEDTVFTFSSGDFPYTDVESDPLDKIRLQAVTAGTLWVDTDSSGALDGAEVAVVNNDEVATADITKLSFLADPDDNGVAYATFDFEVHDGTDYSTTQETMTIDVTAVNDAPTTADNTVTAIEDTVFTFSSGDFPYTDVDSDPINKVRLQAATAGTLWVDTDSSGALDGAEVAVANNDEVSAADFTKLSFLADPDDNGVAYATFDFEVHDGTEYSTTQETMTIDVTAANDPPVTADNTVTAIEDTVFTFASADFPYTDTESDPIDKVRLQAVTAGTLWVDTDSSGALDGAEVAVANNDEVAAADLTKLSFLADPDDNGVAYATFDFEVHDGTDYSTTQETMTIDVTAVNDPPVTADNTVTAIEDTVFTFSSGDFPYTDVESDPINKVRLQAVTAGTLWVDTDSSGALDGAEVVVANNDEVAAADFTKLSFLADPDDNGVAYATFDFEVHDGTDYSTTQETITIDVTAVNDPPVTADNTVTAIEDTVFTFSAGDFPYTDVESDPINKVRLQAVTAGTLWVDTDSSGALDGAEVAVANNDEVAAADFTKLSFLADPDDNGVAYATFDFEVHDGTDYSTTQETMTIDVTAVNDPPVTADNTVTAIEDTVFTFSAGDFPYTDTESDPIDKVRLQAATAGTLWVDTDSSGALDGAEVAVANNDEVAAADFTKLSFLADPDDNGVAYATFDFEVHDGTDYSTTQETITIDVTAVNDPPVTADNTVTAVEDTVFTFASGDFPYTDVESDPINKVRLQAVTAGTLWVDTDSSGALDGAEVAVANNDEVAAADFTKLSFLADPDDNGVAYATFDFEVHDGTDYSTTQETMTIDVTAVNDPPVTADNTVTAVEDTVFTFSAGDFPYTDTESDPIDKVRLQAATAGTLWVDTDSSGALDGAEVAIANNDEVAAADFTKLSFLADPDDNGVAYATFDFEVHDGTDYSTTQETMTIDVTAVNDPPVTADNTVTAIEDTVFTFSSGDFPYTDVESDPIDKVRLQAVTAGTLWVDTDSSGALDGAEVAVANNDEVAAADFTKLSFLADPDDNGVAYATFDFEVHDGTDYSTTQETMTIDVTAVNDPPVTADNTVTAIEDTVFTFAAGDFPYTDVESDPISKVRLQAATAGTLWVDTDGSGALDGAEAAVANNDEVLAADFTKLSFLADLNDNGVAYATFDFEVHDGTDYSTTQETMTIDVTAVNDPPVTADNTVTAIEDTVFTFASGDFPYTDVESDPISKVRLQAATAGTLWVDTDGSGALDGAETAVANNDEVLAADFTKLSFLADLNDNGVAYATFDFEVHDGTDYSTTQETMTIDVTAVNDPPITADNTVTAIEDTVFTFASSDFPYTDVESDPISKVRLQAATAGTLWVDTDSSGALDGAEIAIANNDEVAAADFTKLSFLADPDDNGVAYATFDFEVHDGTDYSTTQETMTIDVTAVNDPPVTADNTVTAIEDTVFTFAAGDFPYTDVESDPLDKIRLQAVTAGTLWVDTDSSGALDGAEVAVANNDEVAAADITKLSFLADPDDSGVAYATFDFEVHDGTDYSTTQETMTIDVTAVNDPPVTADNTVTAIEDTVFTFAAGDFPYTDVESDPISKIRLQAVTAGTLWVDTDGSGALDGAEAAVANNDEVLVADFTKLSFLADLNDNGVAYATFDFEVHDGTDYSTTQETMTIDVTAVNDPPVTADNTVTAIEDTVFTFASGDFPYTDADSDPINKVRLQAVTAGTLWVDTDGSGALDGAEAAVANNDEVLVADFTKLSFLADLNDNGVAYATFDFEVHDGTDYSTTQETMTIDVTAVNDPPVTADNTVTAIEDTVFTFASGDFPYTDVESDPISKIRLQAVTAGTLWVDTDGSGALDGAETAVANNDEVLVADFTKLSFLADLNDNGVAYATFDFEVHDGTDYSTTQETMTIDVTAVNDPPVTADNTVTAIEDTVFTFASGDFPYTDVESDPINKVRLQAVTAGTLWVDTDSSGVLDGAEVAVANNDEVAAADFTKLSFLADPDDNGVAYATFDFEVHDGTDYSTTQETMTIDVTAVNDPPVTADNTVTAIEDTVFTFAAGDFPYTDVESDPLDKIRLQAVTAGTLWVDTDSSGALDGAEVAVANNDEVAAADITKLSFLADPDDNGVAYATFDFEVHDGTDYSTTQETITIDVTAVNDPPVTADNTVTAIEDTVFTFSAGDFPYTDVESDPLNKIRLQAVTAGTLWVDTDSSGALDGAEVAVANNDEVAAADITKLSFLADPDDNGVAYATFDFEVHDGTDYSTTQETMTIDVTAVNDPPVTADNTVTAIEDTVFTFSAGDFPYTDVESDPLNKIRIQAVTAGTLWVDTDSSGALDGAEVTVANNDEVAAADITKLSFLADPDDSGVAYATFDFEVHDGTDYSTTQETMTIDVTAVNDPPVTADNTVTAIEDTVFTFSAGDFPYTDTESDPLNKIRIQAITAGTLWVDTNSSGALDGGEVAIANNDEVPAADITKLSFLADLNDNGVAYAAFDFEVHDGTDYSTTQETMTIDVTAVNDPPVTADNTVTAIEDTVFTFSAGDFPYTDVESDPINKIRLQAVTAGTLWVDTDSSGALDGAEVVVANNDEVAAADFTKLSFLADPDDNGVAYATFDFEVHDGTDYSTTQETMTIDVTAVNDPPVTADNTVTAIEDTVFTFSAGDFPYTDADSDPINKVRLQAVTAGTLWVDTDSSGALDGAEVAIANNDEVAAADFTKLSFLADPDDNGVAYATFDFEVHDGTDYSTTQETMTIDVTAVNDPPVTADNTVTAVEDTVFTFAGGDFPYTDVESDPINKIRLQAVTAGTLWVDTDSSGALDGAEVAVANNDEVAAADFTKLSFLADPDDNGVAYATFDFEVHDGTDYSTTQETMTIDVTAVNDTPTDITLDNQDIMEGEAIGTAVGNFSTTDVDTGDTFTYTLVAGAGDSGNADFNIVGDELQSASVFNFAVQNSYSIRVRVTDSGLATFEKIFTITITQTSVTLTINVDPVAGGSATGDGTYTPGDTANATATANAGYIFAGWTGDIPGGSNALDTPLSVTMDANKTLTAYFTREFHTVDVSVYPEGHGYASGGGVVLSGDTITLTATELAGGDNVPFSHWRINGVDDSTNATDTFTITEDMVVEAVFDMGLTDDFVLVPAQSYTRMKNTRYENTASVSAFYISKYEITKDEWYTVYNWAILNGYTFEFDPLDWNGTNLPHNDPGYDGDFSITGVYWNDMVKWCNARSEMEAFTPSYYTDSGLTTVHRTVNFATPAESLENDMVDWRNRGYRLPTEAEWEAAARGGFENLPYPSGYTIDDNQAFFNQDTSDLAITNATLHARIPNAYGIYDMAGNGWEAVWDWYSKYWYDNPSAEDLDTPGPDLADTQMNNDYHPIRGGSGHSTERWVNVGTRFIPSVWDRFPITIRPVFPAPTADTVNIRVLTQQGSYGTASGGGVIENGTTATLVATPTGTASFVEWQDDLGGTLSTSATYIHTASADATIYAVFSDTDPTTMFTVTLEANPQEAGTLSGQGTYVSGANVQITATAATDYSFSGWYGDAFSTSSPYTVTVNSDMVISAAFDNALMAFDSDSDGLTDVYENAIGSDPLDRDSDNDQISDSLEVNTYGSDPSDDDTDDDGHTDGVEFQFGTNMLNPNSYPFFPKEDLIRHFAFSGGLATDSSNNATDGVASNTTDATDRLGDPSEALTLNGTNAFVDVLGYNGAIGSAARTIAGWVRTAATNSGPIVDYGTIPNSLGVNIAATGELEVIADAATITGTTALDDNTWHHFVVVFPDGGAPGDISIYIDGSLEATSSIGDTVSTLASASAATVKIGTNSLGQFFPGEVDEIRLYERALAAFEVTDLFNMESVAQPVETPISIDVQPVTTTVAIGDPVSLTFTASGGVSPIFQWEAQYGGEWHYIEGENTSTLTFASATDYDGRAYRGAVINQHGEITYTSIVRLYVLHPPTLPSPEPDVSFLTNVGGKIIVNTQGTKTITWEWFKDGVSQGTTTQNFWLIDNTASQAIHGGDYHYVATNSMGSVTSNTFTVSIIDPVTITAHPVSVGVNEGSGGSMSVTATGGGTLTYQWLKYNYNTGGNDELDGETSATLNFTSMDASQEGLYSCQITNGPSTVTSRRARLTMYTPPVFTTHPSDVIVNEYLPAQLDSVVTGDPAPTFQWQKFNTGTTTWENVSRAVRSYLLFNQAIPDNAGDYRVIATNAGGSATSNTATITVYYKPVITTNLDNVYVNEGDATSFNVVAEALDAGGTTINYQWYFNSVALTDGGTISGSTTDTLNITGADRATHYGVYYCELSNAVGTTVTYSRKLLVVEPPVANNSLSDQSLVVGDKLYLGLSVSGTKPFTIEWKKDGVTIPGAIYTKYTIYPVVLGDAATYSVTISNSAGSINDQSIVSISASSTSGAVPKLVEGDISDPHGDPDGDGMANLLEQALGSNPLDGNSTSSPQIDIVNDGNGDLFASISYSVSKDLNGVNVILEQTTDLTNWEAVDLSEASIQTLDRGDTEYRSVYLPIQDSKIFFRVQVNE